MSSANPQARMTSDEFLIWSESQSDAQFELHEGVVIAMAGERRAHSIVKGNAFRVLDAVSLPCRTYVDGIAVRIDETTTYIPDVLIDCGYQSDMREMIAAEPVVIAEVLSDSTWHTDIGAKLDAYFRMPSVQHYLLIDPEDRRVIHHRRKGETIATSIQSTGALDLTPPGLSVTVEALWQGLPEPEEAI